MAEVLVKFDEAILSDDGKRYFAEAAGREREDGLWEGWLEFLPSSEGGEALASETETTQPNRTNLKYWAEGLTRVYLEGALQRAEGLAQKSPRTVDSSRAEASRFETPGRRERGTDDQMPSGRAPVITPHAVLDPYSVYSQGEDILRSELGALSRSQVESIVKAYGFSPTATPADLISSSQRTLIDVILEGVRSKEATHRT